MTCITHNTSETIMDDGRSRLQLFPKITLALIVSIVFLLYYYSFVNYPTRLPIFGNSRRHLYYPAKPSTIAPTPKLDTNNVITFRKAPIIYQRFTNITLPPWNYLVWNPNCHMPNVDIYNSDVMKSYEPKKESCSTDEPLISKIYNETTRKYRLHINNHSGAVYINLPSNDIHCFYQEIKRAGNYSEADENFMLMPRIEFSQDFVVPTHIEALLLECRSIALNNVIYEDAHFFIQVKDKLEQRLAEEAKNAPNLGVLLIGIDSLSRFNFRRTMPKTFEYLERKEWFEMAGYNKMDDNTFPNIMAVSTGFNLSRVMDVCKPNDVGGIDNCTTIWKLYQDNGYVTAMSEDETEMSTFNYIKKGFLYPPTDYYLRPFMLAVEKHLPIKLLSGMKFCIGLRRAADYIYDFGLEFAQRFLHQRVFGIFWANSFSHNYYADSSTMDERMLQYMQQLENSGVLNASAVIFFSDHGSRWGTLRDMPEGFLEERLPMFFMSLPAWFQAKHPDFVYALELNRHRLTSPYDIYMTLKQLLALSGTKGSRENAVLLAERGESCPQCHSIFAPVSENRTCADAGIDDHWCTCVPYNALSINSQEIKNMAQLVVNKINLYLEYRNMSDICSVLMLNNIKEANIQTELGEKHSDKNGAIYRIHFVVMPHEAELEATFEYFEADHALGLDVNHISRLNSYAADSECIEDKIAKKYCICKDVVEDVMEDVVES